MSYGDEGVVGVEYRFSAADRGKVALFFIVELALVNEANRAQLTTCSVDIHD